MAVGTPGSALMNLRRLLVIVSSYMLHRLRSCATILG